MTRTIAISVCVCALLTGGCETPPDQQLPRIDEVRSRVNPPSAPAGSELPRPRALVSIQQITLPLNAPTDTAWAAVDEALFPPVTRSVWNANGLRVGLIRHEALKDLAEALPVAYSIQNTQMLASTHPLPVRRSPPPLAHGADTPAAAGGNVGVGMPGFGQRHDGHTVFQTGGLHRHPSPKSLQPGWRLSPGLSNPPVIRLYETFKVRLTETQQWPVVSKT